MQDLITKLSSDGRTLKMGGGAVRVYDAEGNEIFNKKGADTEALLCRAHKDLFGEVIPAPEKKETTSQELPPAKAQPIPISKPGAIKVGNSNLSEKQESLEEAKLKLAASEEN